MADETQHTEIGTSETPSASPREAVERASRSLETRTDEAIDRAFENREDEQTKARKSIADDDPRYQSEKANAEARRSALEKHVAPLLEHGPASDEAFRRSDDVRRELLDVMPPGWSLADFFQFLEKTENRLASSETRADTAEQLARFFLSLPPDYRKKTVRAEGKSFADQWDKAARDLGDREQLREAAEKYGWVKVEHALRQGLGWFKDGRADPLGTVSRALAVFGEPVTAASRQEAAFATARAQEAAALETGMQRVIASGHMPGLESEAMQHAVADILESEDFQRTGHMAQDLWNAWQQATMAAAKEGAGILRQKASKSISGSPAAASQPARPVTAREALAKQLAALR